MFRVMLGEVRDGRLNRLQFLGYSLLLALLMIGFMFAIVFAIGAGEHIIGGDLAEAQDKLRGMFTVPLMLVMAVVMPLFLFIAGNIMAKRIRDIGLPGWWAVLAVLLVSWGLAFVVSPNASSGWETLVWILLVLVPGGALARSRQVV